MMYIADLHIHSHYSRATSKECTPEYLELWARRKGIDIIGTGDFTHPAWRAELKEKLAPAEEGLYTLKDEYRLEDELAPSGKKPRFVVTGEISSIYKKNGKVRKVHSLILLPGLEDAERLSVKLESIGNIHSDGRPILGLDCHDLLEITLELCPGAVYVPAHIWTPHFSLFGAFSGFDTIGECFGDLTPHIHALETGLSSDPPMNWRISALDSYQLISNSDAHSPAKLGREANLLEIELCYPALADAIQKGEGLYGTIEFFPEEGKYHYDGHRKCHLCLSPSEAVKYGDRCPVCGKKLTIGVMHRVEQLADRDEDYLKPDAKPFESLVPLMEVIAASTGHTPASTKVRSQYETMLRKLGPEFSILRDIPIEEIKCSSGFLVAEGIERLRNGDVERSPGFDGEYGTIRLLDDSRIFALDGQLSLFSEAEMKAYGGAGHSGKIPGEKPDIGHGGPRQMMAEAALTADLHDWAGGDSAGPGGLTEAAQTAAPDGLTEAAQTAAPSGLAEAAQTAAPDGPGTSDLLATGLSAPLSRFNEEQQEAIRALSRAVAVNAGPGTGKTGTLVARILYLIRERGVKPSEITAVTFTNQAAAELRERLGNALEAKRTVRQLNIGTFHALCYQFLQTHRPDFTLADEYETVETAEDIIRRFGLSITPDRFLKEVSLLKTGLADTSVVLPPEAFKSYQESLFDMQVLDFDDLLLETLRLLEEEKKHEFRKQHYNYLLVDEYQDISPVEEQLVRAWSKDGRELFVIGDPDQAIYGFRGSDSRCFERLQEDYPELCTVRLLKNYRSAPAIVGCAASVISRNQGPDRLLSPVRRSGNPVRLVTASGDLSEGIFIAREINRMIGGIDMLDSESHDDLPDSGHAKSFADIAVLYRTHRQAEQLEYCFRKEGIPYIVAGRDEFLREKTVRGAIAFFRYIQNPGDRLSLRTCLRLIWEVTEEDGAELASSLLAAWKPRLAKGKPQKLLEAWMEETGLSGDEPLNKLAGMALFHKTMADFLESLTFGLEGDLKRVAGKTYHSDAITLMTLHGSKGLEFPTVFLYGIRKGLVPLELSGRETDLEEERRLFYVGMTRAREDLILVTSGEPSSFLDELPANMIHKEKADRRKYAPAGKQMSLFDFMK